MALADPKTWQTETRPEWSGINHLALVTSDMDATVRFYCGARREGHRHSGYSTDLELEPFAKGAGVPDPRAPQFDHLSLNLPDEAALEALRIRLAAADCETTEVVDHGTIHSVYFTDNNGIALEASWWVIDVTDGPPDYDDNRICRSEPGASPIGDPNGGNSAVYTEDETGLIAPRRPIAARGMAALLKLRSSGGRKPQCRCP